MTKDKIRGMFLGIAIGDALGKPVEMWSINKIAKTHGRITKYHSCDGHKFFDGHPVGSITDDTILSQAVAEALINAQENLDVHAKYHAEALNHAMGGWGGTTREALKRLQRGVHWSESGKTKNPKRGTGNGVAMKVLPYGAYRAIQGHHHAMTDFMVDLALMTHYTRMAVASGAMMATVALRVLRYEGELTHVVRHSIVDDLKTVAFWSRHHKGNESPDEEALVQRVDRLYDYADLTTEDIVKEFGAGGCYLLHSIPFTLAFWLRNPASIETVYDLASAGGDTDSNCSMGAGLVGAVAGESVFPDELTDNLIARDEILDLADRFCNHFGIK